MIAEARLRNVYVIPGLYRLLLGTTRGQQLKKDCGEMQFVKAVKEVCCDFNRELLCWILNSYGMESYSVK